VNGNAGRSPEVPRFQPLEVSQSVRLGAVWVGGQESSGPVADSLGLRCYLLDGESGRHATSDTIVVAHDIFVQLYYANSTVPSWGRVGVRQTNPSKVKSALPYSKLEFPPPGNCATQVR